jgi:hypothetical protein
VLQFFQSFSLFVSNKIVIVTEFLSSPIMKIFAFVVFIVAMVFLSKFSKQVRVLARYIRMKINKNNLENKQKDLIERQESATKNAETISKAMIGKG